ncbi:nucleoporin NDC1-like [Ornithodoros turicata]|uniref:nucleoporin NDC1-like n=1 Tax=Ornithodoros turicata TaxID=34597 RepID=UPI00313860AD
MSTETEAWFKNEVHFWRCLNFIKYLLIIQELFTPFAIIVLHLSIWHPFAGIFDWFASFLSVQRLCYHFALISVTLLLAFHHAIFFEVSPVVHSTRLGQIWHSVNPHNLVKTIIYGILGGTAVRAFLGLSSGPFGELVVPCGAEGDGQCLNEAHFFLVLHGVFTAIAFHISYVVRGRCYVPFPVIQLSKFVRMNVGSLLWRATIDALKNIYIFYVLYYILGSAPHNWIVRSLGLHAGDDSQLRSLGGLLNFKLFWAAWWTAAVLRFACELTVTLRNIFFTERLQFPVEATFKEEQPQQLINVLRCKNSPLLQCLGFLDFRFLAEHSPQRRAQIFSVSSPGGHPLHWNAFSGECLALIREFTKSLVTAIQPPQSSPPAKAPASVGTPSRDQTVRFRKLAPEWGTHCITGSGTPGPFSPMKPEPPAQSLFAMLVEKLWKQPLVAYFTADLPEARSKKLFAECQPLVWAVEGFCLLIRASYKEDKFGVVQTTLSNTLSALLELDQVLDRHNKGSSGIRRAPGIVLSRDVQLRKALGSAVISGIYQIVTTFGKHLRSVTLSEEHSRRLAQFAEFGR